MTAARILVACIGNVFLGDDGFGVEVAHRLAERRLPEGVRVVDFGIRGLDLVYALLDDYEAAILVDALQRGGAPGTVYAIEPDPSELDSSNDREMLDTHGMHPFKALRMARAMGGQVRCLRVVGCEPATFGSEEDPVMGLSAPVEAAVGEAVLLVESLAGTLLAGLPNRETV